MADLPSASAWGKRRRDFYNTSYVDKDYGGFSGSDIDEAELEEKDAIVLQQQLNAAISIDDYNIDNLLTKQTNDSIATNVQSIDQLNSNQRVQLFVEQNGVEVDGLIDEYRQKRKQMVETIHPLLMKLIKQQNNGIIVDQLQCAIEIYSK